MLGAIIGDIVGSRFEWNNIKTKEFDFLTYRCKFTDDSVMSLAVAKALLDSGNDYSRLGLLTVKAMQEVGRPYPNCGYGGMFQQWMYSNNPMPYNSYGNGAAMRISACGFVAKSLDEAKILSRKVTEVTHNHPEGIKGAEATTVCIFLARNGKSILELRDYVNTHYYPMNFTLNGIRDSYQFNETCQDTVPQAIMAFLESTSFEDAIRNAISIGGDSDTLAAITGSIAEAYYGIPSDIRDHALTFLDERMLKILNTFESQYGVNIEKKEVNNISRVVKYIPVRAIETERVEVEEDERPRLMLDATNLTTDTLRSDEIEWKQTTSQMLFNHLFEACNILRGPINQDEFKTYIIPVLFFKRVSDVYDEETQLAYEDYGEDADAFKEDEIHKFLIPDGCHWSNVREKSVNIGAAIINAMTGIERANPDTLFGVFSSFDDASWTDKSKLSDARLKDLVEHMSRLKVGNKNYTADVMGDAYEYLIKKFADLSKKNAGEFYTPRSVVKLLIQILAPKAGETVYDPACGTGGMLIEAIHYMHDDKMTYGKIFGQEKNLATSAIARMNLFLHGAQDFKVTQGDTLRSPNYLYRGELQTFDCVIANPPFSLENWGADQFSTDIYGRNIWGSPLDSTGDFAWIQHMVKSMKLVNGRCAVILPQGVLSRGGKEFTIRRNMLESDKLECIITLVNNLFYGAIIPACILIFKEHKLKERIGKVLFIDAAQIFTVNRAQNVMTEENIDEVFRLYQHFDDIEGKTRVVSLDEIRAQDYVLTINRYIEKRDAPLIPLDIAKLEFKAAYEASIKAEELLKNALFSGGIINEY